MCTVCAECAIGLENILGAPDGTPRVMWVKWKLASVRLEIVLISTLDSCTVLDERAIGTEIVLDRPNGTPR
jgi:hypothetical protein